MARHEHDKNQYPRPVPDDHAHHEHDVIVNGVLVGRDPDPNIRAQLRIAAQKFGRNEADG